MKTLSWILFIISIPYITLSQQPLKNRLYLRTGTTTPVLLSQDQLQHFNRYSLPVANRKFAILQFESIPSAADKTKLAKYGITLLDYIPNAAYTASITKPVSANLLRTLHIRSILPISSMLKLSDALKDNNQSSDIALAYFKDIPFDTVAHHLAKHGVTIKESSSRDYQLITVHVPAGKMKALLDLPFVAFVDALPPPPEPLNFESRHATGASVLHPGLPGGYNLNGNGITVGICELSPLYPHIDYADRIISGAIDWDFHATHVTGIAAGAGNIIERNSGYAPQASIAYNNGAFYYPTLPSLVKDAGLVLANHSFGGGFSCNTGYNLFTLQTERQPIDFPTLLNVYAGGNSGNSACNRGYPIGFGTIVGGANSAKNSLTVGGSDSHSGMYNNSSLGPAFGGRMKPEITAPGVNIRSTSQGDGYAGATGTSMSSPAAVGALALMNQRYRQLHNGAIPDGGLMKAVISNTATDLGNPGPDYSYGFGRMNVLRAVRSLDHEWHVKDSLQYQEQKQHIIKVPAGTAQLKIMLYWHDAPYNPFSARILTHDLDLKVSTPSIITVLPLVPDTVHSNVQMPATQKEDHWNNIEQVVIDKPAAGDYTVTILGTEIGQSTFQPYYLVYDILEDKVETTTPWEGEKMIPGETMYIRWQDAPSNTATYTLEFSPDNGATWQTINATVPATAREQAMVLPGTPTTTALVRIKRNDGSNEYQSRPFSIIGVAALFLSPVQCPGYIQVQWPAVAGATDYEMFMIRNGQMEPMATTVNTSYTFTGCSPDSTYWVSVRARINGQPGLRATAVSRKPNNGSCTRNIADGDLQLAALLSPKTGRKYTAGELSNNEPIKVRIRNLDDAPSGVFTIQVNINNSGWVSEQINTPMAAGAVLDHSFVSPFNLSALGAYDIRVAITAAGDQNHSNDSIRTTVKHLDNPVIDLTAPFIDSFANAVEKGYTVSTMGLDGAYRYDYNMASNKASLSYGPTFLYGTPVRKGMKLFLGTIGGGHQLRGIYNLSLYDTATHNILLRFNNTSTTSSDHNVWIRTHDTLPWILAYKHMITLASMTDEYSPVINIGRALRQANQNYSAAFQVSFDQVTFNQQWSIAEIELTDGSHDLALTSIDSMKTMTSDLGNATPVYVTLANYGRQAATNVHVKYRINGGAITDEIIPSIAPESSSAYRFNALANLSAYGAHNIEAWIEAAGDNIAQNNRSTFTVRHQPLISAFPYLEDFEKGEGFWYVEGGADAWELGTPASSIIHNAATGQKAWKTNLEGKHNANELTYLYSPCFDLSGLQHPAISMSLFTNLDYCYYSCDAVFMQMSTNGVNWEIIDDPLISYNWDLNSWSLKYGKGWKVTSIGLPDSPKVWLRLLFRSNNNINLDGAAIDDIHIYDSITNIYNGPSALVEQNIPAGNNWLNIVKDGSLVAAINPYNQDLGTVKTKLFMHDGPARNFHGQYYLNRNLHITSEKKPADSIGVRIYFKDSEVDSLLSAVNCDGCTKPVDAYRLGISSSLQEGLDSLNNWSFIPPSQVHMVPFQDGYYAEFKVKDLSAFWLNNGGLDNNSYLPVRLLSFSVSKNNNNALVQWSAAPEINIHHYEIEAAKGNEAFKNADYVKVGEVMAGGPYSFTDGPGNGVYYYRIKAVDAFGNYGYSHALPVVWTDEFVWQVFPNPAPGGQFRLQYQAPDNEPIHISIYNSAGALVKQQQLKGNGFIQQAVIDLKHPSGLYMLQARVGSRIIHIKLIK